ncbi:acylneuraminate cytidylyltransferase family protein [Gammaproteobacteria bacterium]|nr:acylneuraminate cytidylyltransferase family protein [Gammaproteobacteria bacterium]
MKFHAIIPARKGSKGINNKNMHPFLDKPLIEHTIIAAINSINLDSITLSTNDDNILQFATKFDVELLKRPDRISSDNSNSSEIIKHYLKQNTIKNIAESDYIVFLQPTSPFRSNTQIDEAIKLIKENKYDSLISVVESEKSPYKTFNIKNNKLFSLFSEELMNKPRQKLEKVFYPNGAIYIFNINLFNINQVFPNNGSHPFIMDKISSIDIDTKDDLNYASWVNSKK